MKKIKPALVNSRIQKIKSLSEDSLLFDLYKKDQRNFLVLTIGRLMFVTDKNYQSKSLTNLCKVLRKHLKNEPILDIRQHEFDRIVEIETGAHFLVLEFFGNGNMILLDKPGGKIITAFEMREWKDRVLKPKHAYRYPPSAVNPFQLSKAEIEEKASKKEVVKVLAKDLGFGGEVAELICEKIDINKNSRDVDAEKIYNFLEGIEKGFPEFENVNEKLEAVFEEELEARKRGKADSKLETIRKQQLQHLSELEKKEALYRSYAERIYADYSEFEKKLDKFHSLQKKTKREEIEKRLNVKVIPKETTLVTGSVPINFKKSLVENAGIYFEKSKHYRKKIEGLKRSMESKLEKSEAGEEQKKEKKWYENFRWFISSDGFLVVAGKDAETNEKLIRKYMKPSDLVFHTDITGSPFALIKNPSSRKIPDQTIGETAEFCGSYSKAWKIESSVTDVYYVKPEQVKKEGGLPKGSFMIYGKREWVRRVPVRIAIGNEGNQITYGPLSVVMKKCNKYVVVVSGNMAWKELEKIVTEKLGLPMKNLQQIIPYGMGYTK